MSNVNSSLFCKYILEIYEQEEADENGEVSNSALILKNLKMCTICQALSISDS